METTLSKLNMEDMEMAFASYKWKLERQQLRYRTYVSALCTFASGAGTFYAASRLLETSCGAATTTAVGMAVSALSLVGSSTWMLYVSRRYRTLMKRKQERTEIPYVFTDLRSDRALAYLEETILRLEKAILKGVTSPSQNVTESCQNQKWTPPNWQKEVPVIVTC